MMARHQIDIVQPSNQRVAGRDTTVQLIWNPTLCTDWEARYRRAQMALDMEVLRTTEPYVPFETGVLARSPMLSSDIGSGLLVWATPYAAAQYYGTADSRPYAALRGAHWFERAKADRRSQWERVAREAMG